MFLCSLASGADAQLVRGRVMNAGGGTAIAAAHVLLLDSLRIRVGSTLSSSAGAFELAVAHPGSYIVRAEMIGRRSVETTVTVPEPAGGYDLVLQLPIEPVALAALVVHGSSRCEMAGQLGAALQTVWDEARKALALEVTTRESQNHYFLLERFERLYDPSGRRLRGESVSRFPRYAAESFRSLAPEDAARRGYLETRPDGSYVYGPTAEILISDDFLQTHCFSLRINRGEELIGLQFRPASGGVLTEIRGTLWLDTRTSELRFVEFEYVNLPDHVNRDGYGGKASFQRLPSGGMIVREWSIRWPVVESIIQHVLDRPVLTEAVAAVYEEGGSVIAINAGVGDVPPAARLSVPSVQYVSVEQTVTLTKAASSVQTERPKVVFHLSELNVAVAGRSRWLEANGFYDRRDRGGAKGHFIERALIERRKPAIVTDLFYDLPGVKTLWKGPGRVTVVFNRAISFKPEEGGCTPAVYLDGSQVGNPDSGVTDINALPVAQLEAVEVYIGPAAPIQFQHACGVILLWSRRAT